MSLWICRNCGTTTAFRSDMRCQPCGGPLEYATVHMGGALTDQPTPRHRFEDGDCVICGRRAIEADAPCKPADPPTPVKVRHLAPAPSAEDRLKARQDQAFFTVLPRPVYPDCDHTKRGVTLDRTKRVVTCKCGAVIDAFDALMVYADSEQRLISTKEDIERYKEEEETKKREATERKPFLRDVGEYSAVWNPAPPDGDGAIVGYDVTLSCGHTVRWGSRGRRSPGRRMTCDICVRIHRAKKTGTLAAKETP